MMSVHARWPNNAEALEALALIERRLGKLRESDDNFSKLILLDPLVPIHRTALAGNLMSLRDFPDALRVLDDGLKIWPDDGLILASKADAYQRMGRLDLADAALKNVHPAPDNANLYWGVMEQFWLRHQYGEGAAYFRGLIEIAQEREDSEAVSFILRVALGELLRMKGDLAGAKENYSRAIEYMVGQLKKQPDNSDLLIPLSVAYAGIGDSARALRTSDQSIELFRKMNDRLDAEDAADNHMHLMARLGDHAEAIKEIEVQLNSTGPTTIAILRLDPDFDALRGDPRFVRLLTPATLHQ
jgi:tetratricopeptide (TPR) repeat protein